MADQTTRPADNPTDRFLLLVVRYFDGALDEAEQEELNALLRSDPECRREFAEYSTRCCQIRETLDPERQRAEMLPQPDEVATPRPRTLRRRKQVLVLASLAASLLIASTLTWVLWPSPQLPREIQAEVVGAVEPGVGEVRVISADGQTRVIDARTDIRSGDTVRTEPVRGTAVVAYADGTRLTLVGDTAVTCSGTVGKTVVMHQGTVGASVTPQPPGSPMVIATPVARIEVRGTEFYCQAFPDRTDVSVTKGSVRVVQTSDGSAVDVSEGQRVLAQGRAVLAVQDTPRRSDVWELDFENGLPANFHRGRFVTEGLPRGSKGGVAAIRSTRRDTAGYFEIATPEMWNEGLFAFHPDSHLHVTYRMERPNWVNIFVCARGSDPNGPHVGNYLCRDAGLYTPPKPGKWQTVTIPLATLRRAGMVRDVPPGADEVPYMLLFSSEGDRGLVIDRIWVTRGGPGVVQINDVE